MAITLADSWAKYDRAMEHFETLALESEEYLRGAQVSAVVTTDGGVASPSFEVDTPPPARLGTIAGDIAHNLRSALDVAAWQLAIDHDEAAARRRHTLVQFPLTGDPEGFKGHKALAFFSPAACRVVEALQPYQRSTEALGWLREISNSDKHRLATFSFAGMPAVPAGREVGVQGFGSLEIRFGTDEGHLGLFGVRAIAAAVAAALQVLEDNFAQSGVTT